MSLRDENKEFISYRTNEVSISLKLAAPIPFTDSIILFAKKTPSFIQNYKEVIKQ